MRSFKPMWTILFFDLPTHTKEDKMNYSKFRHYILKDGFEQLQYSVYSCFNMTKSKADARINRVCKIIPKLGHVRMLNVTANQYSEMKILINMNTRKPEKPKEQLILF